MEQNKKIKTAITVLSVLLAVSLLALGVKFIKTKTVNTQPDTVTVPDNLITSEEEESKTQSQSADEKQNSQESNKTRGKNTQVTNSQSSVASENSKVGTQNAVSFSLYNKQPRENTSFRVGNMFPGDSETKYYRIKVSYKDKVTVNFKADVRPGYEKLAEVLNLRVKLLNTNEVMYDGKIADMPQSLAHKLVAPGSATDELYYEITAYIDTSVGNDYQNKDLTVDFKWWAEEPENLAKSPDTGDIIGLGLPAAAAGACLVLLLLLVMRKRREEEENVR